MPAKRETSVTHDEVIVGRLQKNAKVAGECLNAAPDDTDERRVLLLALRHLAIVRAIGHKLTVKAGRPRP